MILQININNFITIVKMNNLDFDSVFEFESRHPDSTILDVSRKDNINIEYEHCDWWTGPWDDDNTYYTKTAIEYSIIFIESNRLCAEKLLKISESDRYSTIDPIISHEYEKFNPEEYIYYNQLKNDPDVRECISNREMEEWVRNETRTPEPIEIP